MKSAPVNVGNVNMRGKKVAALRCGCCTARDLRDKQRLIDERRILTREEIEMFDAALFASMTFQYDITE